VLDVREILVRFSVGSKDLSVPQNVGTGTRVLQASYSIGTAKSVAGGLSDREVKLTTCLQLVPKLRMGGDVRPFLYKPQWCAHLQLNIPLP